MTKAIVFGVILLAIIICVLILYFKVVRSIRNFSSEAFGTPNIIEGYKKTKKMVSARPKSISSMEQFVMPQIKNDFPEFSYNDSRTSVENLILNSLSAIEEKNAELVERNGINAPIVKGEIQNIVSELTQNNLTEKFDEIDIHDTKIREYNKKPGIVTIVWNTSIGFLNYTLDENGKIVRGDKDLCKQTVYKTEQSYIQDIQKIKDITPANSIGINCPNCGAPIKNLGEKFCEYCGTGIKDINIYSWSFTKLEEEGSSKKIY